MGSETPSDERVLVSACLLGRECTYKATHNDDRALARELAERGLEPGVMPSRPQLEELGRFDIARALEKHGGAAGIARKIGLEEPRYRARKAKAEAKQRHKRKPSPVRGGGAAVDA